MIEHTEPGHHEWSAPRLVALSGAASSRGGKLSKKTENFTTPTTQGGYATGFLSPP